MPTTQDNSTPQRDIYSISRLNSEVRAVLNNSFPLLWVEGEISNLARPSSGHIYFSLKDQYSQVRCAMFRMKRQLLRFEPENGMQVLVRARPNLYEARGDYQLSIEHMEPGGEGLLRQAFEELKQRLDREGLFDASHKLPIPQFPRQIGVITSPSGAAIRDVVSVLKRRFPAIPVVIYPVQVQGDAAVAEIIRALELAKLRAECDLVILTRGGGSLEDMMAFNHEQVARAIYSSAIPIISAIGHEIDFTISDFVADIRAATPSAAAELATPDRRELAERLSGILRHLTGQMTRRQQTLNQHLQHLRQRLDRLDPGVQLGQRQQRLDELELRIARNLSSRMQQQQQSLANLVTRLKSQAPRQRITLLRQKTQGLQHRMQTLVSNQQQHRGQQLAAVIRNLNTLNPLATLERGYSITTMPDGKIVDNASNVSVGDRVETRLATGKIGCLVETCEDP
jgi:exodeoxyribonuclease VII large subunit